MLIIWMVTLVYVLIGYMLNDFFPISIYMTVSFIGITSILLIFILLRQYIEFFLIILGSFVIRVFLLVIDLYGNHIVTVPHSGDDTENFYATGLLIADNMSLLGESVYGGTYSQLLGVFFNIYGDDRLFIQFINILIAITAIIIVIKIFRMLNIRAEIQMLLVLIMAYFPHSLIFSSILLRESIISLTVVCSIYFFIKWFKYNGIHNALFSVLLVLIGGFFHSGILGILIGYLFAFMFYRHQSGKLKFTLNSTVPFTIITSVLVLMLIFPELFAALPLFSKFEQELGGDRSIYDAFNSERGGSAYLTGLEINNIFQMIVFSPIKILYFIGSPMPWTMRNINDFISFFLDALFYLFAAFVFIKNFRVIRRNPLLLILLLSLVSGWLIFGLGISNAGTALRHRFKLFYIIIIILGILWSLRKRE